MKTLRSSFFIALLFGCGLFFSEIFREDKIISSSKEKEKPETEAIDALQWLNNTRAYPSLDIPADAYTNAMNQQQTRFANQRSMSVGAWTSIGPNNIGGRTLCLALDPNDTNIVWLGSASGGLWKTNNGGLFVNDWTYMETGFPVLGVATIAINPQNSFEMFIGTGEGYNQGTATNGLTDRTTRGSYGMGILKSTDGGFTWAYSLNWSYQQQSTVWEIIYNPLNSNTVFAATSEGVYRSTNAGSSWTQVLNVPMCMDIAMHETDTTVLLVGAGNINSANKGLYRSTDGGSNWALAGGGFPNIAHQGRITIELYPDNNDVMMAQLCDIFNTIGFYKSTDKGATWTAMAAYDACGYQAWYCAGMAFKPGDPNEFLAGGIYMHRSQNGGANFFQTNNNGIHADIHAIVVNPQNPNSVFVATDAGLYRSWDFGDSFTPCTDGYVTSQCYIGSVSQQTSSYALTGLQDNNSIQYTGNVYWNPVLGGDGCYNLIDPSNDQTNFAAYQYLNVYYTPDQWSGGFQVISTPSSAFGGNPAAFLAPIAYAPGNTQRMYAGEIDLLRSDDGGFSWSVISASPIDSNNVILSIGISSTNEDSLYIATAPDFANMKFMISDDGGATFSDRSTGLPNRFPRRILVDPSNSRIVYVVFSGFGTGHIFKSTNAGITWTDISATLPNVPFHCIICDPLYPNIIYAGSDIGLYVSLDGGINWQLHNTGLYDWTMVFDLQTCANDRSIFCFTHGHGVWKRNLDDVIGVETHTASSTSVSVFPNPANEQATITIGETYGPTTISVFDLNGKLIYSESKTLNPAQPVFYLNTALWKSGVYLVHVESVGTKNTKRLVVQH
jgi:photosystem II stability/assembly factor-like uncharacterized protein